MHKASKQEPTHKVLKSSKKSRQRRSNRSDLKQETKVSYSVKGRWSPSHLDGFKQRLATLLSASVPQDLHLDPGKASIQSMATSGTSAYDFALMYQLQAITKKHFDPSDKSQQEMQINNALTVFFEGEKYCNEYKDEGKRKLLWPEDESALLGLLPLIRSEISALIGDSIPPFEKLFETARPGPGASFRRPNKAFKGAVTRFYKLTEPFHLSVSAKALPYAQMLITSDQRWCRALEEAYRCGNRASSRIRLSVGPLPRKWLLEMIDVLPAVDRTDFAPKDAEKFRLIGIGPGLNIMLQLGVDGFFREQLHLWGVDLNSQQHNQNLVRVAHELGLATLDLKNASGSIAQWLVEMVFPPDWYNYLCKLRCEYTILPDGTLHQYEVFSSMGNGYTFALESLLFAAIIRAVAKLVGYPLSAREYAVFGDDLIVPQELALVLTEALAVCGFATNPEKTYIFGAFRESCGHDYYTYKGKSHNVRPIYAKEFPQYVDDVFGLYNRLRRWALEWVSTCETEVEWLLNGVLDSVPPGAVSWGPPLVDEVGTHLFTTDRNKLNVVNGQYKFNLVMRKAKEYNTPDTFWFRRLLMAKLQPSGHATRKAEAYTRADKYLREGVLHPAGLLNVLAGFRKGMKVTLDASGTGDQFRLTRRNEFTVVTCAGSLPQWQALA